MPAMAGQTSELSMMAVLSNADALLVAVPMISLLVVGHFRLDELVGKPRKRVTRRHELAGVRKDGGLTCLDPDGTAGGQANQRRKLPVERRRPRVEAERE